MHINLQTKLSKLFSGHITQFAEESAAWQVTVNLKEFNFLIDHGFQGMAVLPGTAYIEMATAVFHQVAETEEQNIQLSDIEFQNIILLKPTEESAVKITLEPKGEKFRFTCSSLDSSVVYATLSIESAEPQNNGSASLDLIKSRLSSTQSGADLYGQLRTSGNEYGPAFQGIEQLWRTDGEALGQLSFNSEVTAEFGQSAAHPVLMDVCTQVLSQTSDSMGKTFVLAGFDAIQLTGRLSEAAWSHARVTSDATGQGEMITGDVTILDAAEQIVATLVGGQFKYLDYDSQASKTPIAIAATFTGEPIENTLKFWGDALETPFDVKFAPYNQVFQELLDPNSLLSTNQDGLNVLMVRFEDWIREDQNLKLQVSDEEKEQLLADHNRRTLPNKIEIAHLNQYETDYVYQEIFADRSYLKHGITINDGDTIVDIGANIGLFTLFCNQQAKETTIYCFDPSPPIFKMLETNVKLYGADVRPFNIGISDKTKTAEFTFYKKSSVFSSFNADAEDDEAAVAAVVENMLGGAGITDKAEVEKFVAEMMEDRMESVPYQCQLKSLSDMIREENIEYIDLLKVDAEKSELEILQGIEEQDWAKIGQLVLEVHDREGSYIADVQAHLISKGFELEMEEEDMLTHSGLYNIFATRPEHVAKVKRTHADKQTAAEKITQNVNNLTGALKGAAERSPSSYLVMVCPPSPVVATDKEMVALFAEMETALLAELSDNSNIFVTKTSDLMAQYPAVEYYDSHSDMLGHIPYTAEFFSSISSLITRKFSAMSRPPYKVIVLDCDNTLWGGVAGEDGPQGVEISEPFKALQAFMIEQTKAGMVLCLASKNVEEDVFAVFDARDDMPLKREHIVTSRINWERKSQNIQEMAEELNLGLDSFIFIDDNPVEIAEVSASLPMVLSLQLPESADEIEHFLNHVWAFDHLNITEEDRKRTAMYQQNMAREQYKTDAMTLTDFLDGLNIDIQVNGPTAEQMPRVAQLTNRTNQFNFTTVRRSEADIAKERAAGTLDILAVTVTDRFGDYGLVGDVFYTLSDDAVTVDTFLLSCRVLGRGVEHTMLAKLGEIASAKGLDQIKVTFTPTAKNKPALDFLESVAADYKSETDGGLLFTIPADYAAGLTYSPANAIEYDISSKKKSATAPAAGRTNFAKIAAELNSSAAVLKLAEANVVEERPELEAEYVAPANNLERSIAQVWQEVLAINKIGIYDNFREVGGTSLKGVQLVAQLKRDLKIDISIIDLFESPTISLMTAMLEQNSKGDSPANEKQEAAKSRGAARREARKARRKQA